MTFATVVNFIEIDFEPTYTIMIIIIFINKRENSC